jgi:hypothetical protein
MARDTLRVGIESPAAPLMIGLIVAVVALRINERPTSAPLLLAGAALANEVAMLSAVGLAWWSWSQGRKRTALLIVAVPLMALGSWLRWVREVFGSELSRRGALDLPFLGVAEALGFWEGTALMWTRRDSVPGTGRIRSFAVTEQAGLVTDRAVDPYGHRVLFRRLGGGLQRTPRVRHRLGGWDTRLGVSRQMTTGGDKTGAPSA